MNLFNSFKRRNSKANVQRSPATPPPPTPPLPPSPRPPLVPNSNFDPQVTHAEQAAKYAIGRRITVNADECLATQSQSSTQPGHDLHYTHNSLNSFSFGAGPSASLTPSRPVDPLSPRDDADSDDYVSRSDTTPRPSLASSHPHSLHSHSSQVPGRPDWHSPFQHSRHTPSARGHPPGERRPTRDSDAASFHIFGTSPSVSASASMTSLTSATNSRSPSRTSSHMASSADLTSEDGNEHRHPVPPGVPVEGEGHAYLSEEEFDDDFDFCPDDIDISSQANEGSDKGTLIDYTSVSSASMRRMAILGERRGSLAMPIPGTPPYADGRAREDSLATLRRPSKSLEDLRGFIPSGSGASPSAVQQERPLPPAPTSVPESEGDWRELRTRSMQRDEPITANSTRTGASSVTLQHPPPASAPLPPTNNATDGFDIDFSRYATGIHNIDEGEMRDIVGDIPVSGGRRPSRMGGLSFFSNERRRSSVGSSNMDTFLRNVNGKWAGDNVEQRDRWTFKREQADPSQMNGPEVKSKASLLRERASISSRPSRSGEGSTRGEDTSGKELVPSKGLPVGAEEIWRNAVAGRFRVTRRNFPARSDPNSNPKPPQRRLSVQHLRGPDLPMGPPSTVHKHSKTVAFSIHRQYRPAASSSSSPPPPSQGGSTKKSAPAVSTKKSRTMILLGPPTVQKAYTNTPTTRKLESHGQLNDSGRMSSRDVERMRRERQEERGTRDKDKQREKEKQKEKENRRNGSKGKSGSSKQAAAQTSSGSSSRSQPSHPQTSSSSSSKGKRSAREVSAASRESSAREVSATSRESSAGSVVELASSASSTLVSCSPPSLDRSPVSASASRPGTGSSSGGTANHEAGPSHRGTRFDPGWDEDEDPEGRYEDDDLYSSDGHRRPPTRTPHGEAYSTIAPELLDSFSAQGYKGKGKGKANGHIAPYNPPWILPVPRQVSEQRNDIVVDLNASFQDVGLLPMPSTESSKSGVSDRKHGHHSSAKHNPGLMEDENAFYMLLPLRPGQTDSVSAKKFPFKKPYMPMEKEQFLLVHYKQEQTNEPEPEGKPSKGSESKKRSRESPTSSRDSADNANVLFNKFYIGARMVSYSKLQGTNFRIPDEGLSVEGPMADAFASIPPKQENLEWSPTVIGECSSRESGIRLDEHGLLKLGLCRVLPPPPSVQMPNGFLLPAELEESMMPPEPEIVPTPIGLAIIELVWMGGLALTTFGSL